jgi:hypothetical protein
MSEVNRRLAGREVCGVDLLDGTLDLNLRMSSGLVFQVIPDSSGYESWHVHCAANEFIATGDGRLDKLPRPKKGG